jgi:hypothetical protein
VHRHPVAQTAAGDLGLEVLAVVAVADDVQLRAGIASSTSRTISIRL